MEFWEELDTIGRAWNLPWIMVGDFNAVRTRAERSSGRASKLEREQFANLLDEFDLLELSKIGPDFTYKHGTNGACFSRLDRYLVNPAWVGLFKAHVEKPLGFYNSDHRLLLLQDECLMGGPIPFKFELFWLQDTEILKLMEEWWIQYEIDGKAGFVLSKKLKNLKGKLKIWARQKYGRFGERIQNWEAIVSVGVKTGECFTYQSGVGEET